MHTHGILLERDFIISDNAAKIPLPQYPVFINFSMIGLCRSGWADLNIGGKPYQLTPNHLITLLPQQAVALIDKSPDFEFLYFVVPQTLFHDLISMMRRFSPRFFFFMHENFAFNLSEEEQISDFVSFCRLLKHRVSASEEELRRELAIYTLATLYMDLYQYYKETCKQTDAPRNQRKEELTYEFFGLVATHHLTHKDVAFYADKMNITPTYLTIVVKETCGLSAKEWLINFITQKIKSKLRDPRLNMQEIALELNFPTQTAMNRFFRNYTGMSLTEYRKSTTP